MSERERQHLVYLLRLWRVRVEDGEGWRASLQSARSGERLGFASLDQLFSFLRGRTGGDVQMADGTGDTGPDRPTEPGSIGREEKA